MAQLKKLAAEYDREGTTLKNVINEMSEEQRGWSKWDISRTVLWLIAYKMWRWTRTIVFLMVLLIFFLVFFALGLSAVVTSPLWFLPLICFAPKATAEWLNKDPKEPKNNWACAWKFPWFACYGLTKIFLDWAYRCLWRCMPMTKRQWYIKANKTKIKTLRLEDQVAYYDNQKDEEDKVNTLKTMKHEAMRMVWERGNVTDRGNILQAWKMRLEDFQLLFNGAYSEVNLLKGYCASEKAVSPKLQLYFVEQLEKGKLEGESELDKTLEKVDGLNKAQTRALQVLRICCVNSLDTQTLLALIKLLGSAVGEQAKELLNIYWSRNTLSDEVVKQLVTDATNNFLDEGRTRADELLMQAVKRDGISTANAELFFARCDSDQGEELDRVIKARMDISVIDREYICADNEDGVAKLKQYFGIREHLAPEAQLLLREWQYDLYHESGHELDEATLEEFLVKKLQEKDKSFFEKVVAEGIDRKIISDTATKLMLMSQWKRRIVLDAAERLKEREEGITL